MNNPTQASEPQQVDREDAFNFNKEQYEELFATERQLGTTRARIVWTPATVAVGMLALFLKGGDNKMSPKVYFISITIMYLVLFLVWSADIYLHREQKILRKMCQRCEMLWIKSAKPSGSRCDTSSGEILSFFQLRLQARTTTHWVNIDISNGLLIAYFMAISLIPIFLIPVNLACSSITCFFAEYLYWVFGLGHPHLVSL